MLKEKEKAMNWQHKDGSFRQATPQETQEHMQLSGSPHVYFGCLCGTAYWTAKNLALNPDGTYNGMRNIFYYGEGPECKCSGKDLRHIVVSK